MTTKTSNDLQSPLLSQASDSTSQSSASKSKPNFFGRCVIRHTLELSGSSVMLAASIYFLTKGLFLSAVATGGASMGFLSLYALDRKITQSKTDVAPTPSTANYQSDEQDLEVGASRQVAQAPTVAPVPDEVRLKIVALEKEVHELTQSSLKANREIAGLKSQNSQLRTHVQQLEEDNTSLQQQLDDKMYTITEKNAAIIELNRILAIMGVDGNSASSTDSTPSVSRGQSRNVSNFNSPDKPPAQRNL